MRTNTPAAGWCRRACAARPHGRRDTSREPRLAIRLSPFPRFSVSPFLLFVAVDGEELRE
jgi:hypothetical protein